MSDALILENLYQRSFTGEHQIHYKHPHRHSRQSSTTTTSDLPSTTATMPYSIHEPAPNHPQSMSYGRGGAGNRTRPLPPSSLANPLTPTETHKLHTQYNKSHDMPNFSTGRGGVGNMHGHAEERRMFSFDEELAKENRDAVPVYHIGRGGQGNAVKDRRESDTSASSRGSEKRGSLDWVKGLARKA